MDRVNGSPILGSLMFLTGPLAGNTYQLTKSVILIGREPGCDIVVSDPAVSRQHAQLTWSDNRWSIKKVQQRNSLKINDRETEQGILHDRDTIILGMGTTFVFQAAQAQSESASMQSRRNVATPSPYETESDQLSFEDQVAFPPSMQSAHFAQSVQPVQPAQPMPPAQSMQQAPIVPQEQAPQQYEPSSAFPHGGADREVVPQDFSYFQDPSLPMRNETPNQNAQPEYNYQREQANPAKNAASYPGPQRDYFYQQAPAVPAQQQPSYIPEQPQSFPQAAQMPQAPVPPAPQAPQIPPSPSYAPAPQRPYPQTPPTQKASFGPQGQPPQLIETGMQQAAPSPARAPEPQQQQYGPLGTVTRGVPSLEVTTNTDRDKLTYPLNKAVINIGRAPAPTNDIVIDRPTVSGQHAQIIREGNQLIFIHPHPQRGKTLNGVQYNGKVIGGEEQLRVPLSRGDIIRISDEHGTMVTLTYNDGTGAAQDAVPDIRPIALGASVITLGRAPDNMVVLNHPQVSSHHARLEATQVNGQPAYRIVDQGSTNHVYINTKRVTNQVLKPGDEIRIGPFKLTFTGHELTQHDESSNIRIDALHLLKKGNKNEVIINDISITIPPRKFVAVVGGSGAGKSTLLDTLNGLRPAQQGMVLYNGQDYYRNMASFSTQLGYVPQDDIIHRELTVERALYYAAKLRLPSDYTSAQIKERIEQVLVDVDMKSRRKMPIYKLSGGQRKRVSIALELLANPNVFFLDEPTSGLDPGLDRKMMSLLRKLADKGRTIILVTHATNNINSCDYVCFLSRGGYLAYFGPPDEALAYFGKSDFAEIYSMLEPTDDDKDIPHKAAERFKQSAEYQRYVVQPLTQGPAGRIAQTGVEPTVSVKLPKRGNPWKQFWLLSMRYLELLKNDTGNLLILLLQAPIIALVLFFLAAPGTFETTSTVTCAKLTDPRALVVSKNQFDCANYQALLSSPQGPNLYTQQTGLPFISVQDSLNHVILPASGTDPQKILLIMAFAAVMFGCINGAREIVKESAVYKRERAVNLGILPYLFSKIVVLGVLCLLQSAVLVFIVNLRAPFHHSVFLPPVTEIYITMALTALAGLMVGLMLSALAPNNDRAMSIVPVILIPQIIFSGAIFALSNPFLQFLGWFFAAHWAMAGMGSTVGLHADKLVPGDDFIYQGTLFSGISQPQAIAHLLLVWVALAVLIVGLGFLTAYFLRKKDVRV